MINKCVALDENNQPCNNLYTCKGFLCYYHYKNYIPQNVIRDIEKVQLYNKLLEK